MPLQLRPGRIPGCCPPPGRLQPQCRAPGGDRAAASCELCAVVKAFSRCCCACMATACAGLQRGRCNSAPLPCRPGVLALAAGRTHAHGLGGPPQRGPTATRRHRAGHSDASAEAAPAWRPGAEHPMPSLPQCRTGAGAANSLTRALRLAPWLSAPLQELLHSAVWRVPLTRRAEPGQRATRRPQSLRPASPPAPATDPAHMMLVLRCRRASGAARWACPSSGPRA